MRKLIIAAGLMGLAAGTATAAEFQPIGTLGMGGAGVARNMGAYASYWNPAGLAFADKAFTMTAGAGVGLRVSDGLADNVDRLSKFTEGDPSTFDNLKNLSSSGSEAKAVADMVSLLSVLQDVQTEKGTISLNVDAAVGFQYKQFGFGLFGIGEGFTQPLTDLTRILPAADAGTTTISAADLATNAFGQSTGWNAAAPEYFTAAQVTTLTTQFSTAGLGLSGSEINDIIASVDKNLAATGGNPANVGSGDVVNTITGTLIPALQDPASTNTIDNNQTAVMVKNVVFAEVPIAYGYAFDFGKSGKLGIGGAVKAVRARVYQSRVRLIENGESVQSDDIVDALRDNYEESTNVTFDLGAQYKYADWLTAGLVLKNLTSPTFKSPLIKDQKGNYVDQSGAVTTAPYREADVELKPQARLGVAFDPYPWLTIAADLDLTENETVLADLNYKSRHLGGGFEVHALSWLKIRGGIYENIAVSEIGPVVTAGLTLGIPWVLLEVDGAYGLDKARYDNEDYPKEARVQAQLTVQF